MFYDAMLTRCDTVLYELLFTISTHDVEAAYERYNVPEIGHVAHRLVGRLSYLHAKPTVTAAHELERYCKFTRSWRSSFTSAAFSAWRSSSPKSVRV